MMKIGPEGTLRETDELRFKAVKPKADNLVNNATGIRDYLQRNSCNPRQKHQQRSRRQAGNGPRSNSGTI